MTKLNQTTAALAGPLVMLSFWLDVQVQTATFLLKEATIARLKAEFRNAQAEYQCY